MISDASQSETSVSTSRGQLVEIAESNTWLQRVFSRSRKSSIVRRILWLLLVWGVLIYLLSVVGIWWGSNQVIEDSFKNQAIEWTRKLDELGTPLYAGDDQRVFEPIQEHVARFPEMAYLRYYRANDYTVIAEYTSDRIPEADIPYLSDQHFEKLVQNVEVGKTNFVDTFDGDVSLMRASAPILIRSIESDGLMEFNLDEAAVAEKYKVIGFVTVYESYQHAYKYRARISQFLILPCYQRQGHDKNLLEVSLRFLVIDWCAAGRLQVLHGGQAMLRNNRGAADRCVPLDARHVRHPDAARKRLLHRDHVVLGRKAREKQNHEGQLRLDRA